MRLVEVIDGALELRWTWLPYWLATNGKLKQELEAELKATIASETAVDQAEYLDRLHELVCRRIQERFPQMRGLEAALASLKCISS